MIDWKSLEIRSAELESLLLPLSLDQRKRKEFQREKTFITNLLNQNALINALESQLNELLATSSGVDDPSMAELYELEKQDLQHKLKTLQDELEGAYVSSRSFR